MWAPCSAPSLPHEADGSTEMPQNIALWPVNSRDFRRVKSDTCGSLRMRVFGQTARLVNPESRHVYQRAQQPVPATHRKKESYLARYSPHQNMRFGATPQLNGGKVYGTRKNELGPELHDSGTRGGCGRTEGG